MLFYHIHTHLVQIGPHGIADRLLVLLQHLLQLLKLVRAVSLVLLHTPSNVTSESTANFRHDLRNNVMSYCMYVHACTCRSCLLTLGISSSAVSTRTGQTLAIFLALELARVPECLVESTPTEVGSAYSQRIIKGGGKLPLSLIFSLCIMRSYQHFLPQFFGLFDSAYF